MKEREKERVVAKMGLWEGDVEKRKGRREKRLREREKRKKELKERKRKRESKKVRVK